MTGQIADKVVFRGTTSDLAEHSGGPLYDPVASGLRPTAIHTACWRGFIATYLICAGRFVLHDLEINDGDQVFPLISGVQAGPADEQVRTYRGVDLPIPFSGTLLIGTDFDSSLYVHMGFQPAWTYRTVWEITCVGGAVTREVDRSAEIHERPQHPQCLGSPSTGDADAKWIDGTVDGPTPRDSSGR